MCRLVESIRIENGKAHLIELHNERFNIARKALFGATDFIDLEKLISIPPAVSEERYKCRVVTNGKKFDTEILPYQQREIRTLKVVHNDEIDYTYKLDDRRTLNKLFSKRGKCDDILIIKNSFLTDSSAANVLLFDGNEWVTPSTPLLKGVQRQWLINRKRIREAEIHFRDILRFEKIKLINAMIDFDRATSIDVHTCVCFDSAK